MIRVHTVVATVVVSAAALSSAAPSDPIAAEVARWQAFTRESTASDDTWKDLKPRVETLLASTEQALRDSRRFLALLRLAAVRETLGAAAYVQGEGAAAGKDLAAFEAEWRRMGDALRDDLAAPAPEAFAGVRPAAVRALAEAAQPRVRVYYDSSLEYGRNTMAEYGLFYLGAAQAQRDFAAFARTLAEPSGPAAPALRSLATELDALEGELLAVYRPPASIDKHAEFITASATVKEARGLDAAGLRHGALLRYLQAAQRFAPLRAAGAAPASAPAPGALAEELRRFRARLDADRRDHSVARMFVEAAEADLAAPAGEQGPVAAAAIVSEVLPRYFPALEPAPPAPPRPAPAVTVTMVRWPYT